MTKNEFLAVAHWKQEHILEGNFYSALIEEGIAINILFNQFDTNREVSDNAISSLNDFLHLDQSSIDWIKQELWRNCEFNFHTSALGTPGIPRKDDQSEFEANQDFFSIYDADDAFRKAQATRVIISNDTDIEPNTCFWLEYEVPWNYENKMTFIFVNGRNYRVE